MNYMRRLLDLPSRKGRRTLKSTVRSILAAVALATGMPPSASLADETCVSPYMPKITDQEELVYV